MPRDHSNKTDYKHNQLPCAHIPAGSDFNGDINTRSDIRIDGSIKGNVTASGNIDIGPDGMIEGVVTGRDIHVAGNINGDLISSAAVHLLAGANLTGNLTAVSLTIQENACFNGRCVVEKQAVSKAAEHGEMG